jgi:DNA-binding NtrC family response regulator
MPTSAAHGRILVIDDEESLRLALTKGLTRLGYEAEAVATGKEGVDRFTAGGWDAVLTDVRLPDLSGLDVVAVLTEMDADVPVVVMTGYGTVETALEALRRGAKDYVQKPFSVDEVGRIVARAIEERRLSHENRRLRALVERRFAQGGYEHVDAELATRHVPPGGGSPDRRGEAANGSKGGSPARAAPPPREDEGPVPLREAQRRFEVRYVTDLLARTGGNIAAAARLAGISRPNFHKKLRSLGVDPSGFKQAARRGRIAQL